jgi:hypothetical protein
MDPPRRYNGNRAKPFFHGQASDMQNPKAAVQDPKEITKLKDAIRATHGCESLHVESVAVKDVFEGQTASETNVEVFDLVGHRQAKRAYAWSYRDGNQNKTFAVLEIPPVDSPETAVKVAIASKARSN